MRAMTSICGPSSSVCPMGAWPGPTPRTPGSIGRSDRRWSVSRAGRRTGRRRPVGVATADAAMSAEVGQLLSSSGAARRAASQILAEGRFHQPHVPRPLHGLLAALGSALQAPLRGLDSLVATIATAFPGGVVGVWALFAALALAAGVAVSTRVARRGLVATASPRTTATQSAAELERLAAAAQDAGRLDQAVRLRF